jgi:hypothetical protein
MVYSPTAWETNDVITKNKLNKIEQGVKTGTLLSGTDIDADKNWNGKNITNVGTVSAAKYGCATYILTASPHGQICYQDNTTSATGWSATPIRIKTAPAVPTKFSGTVQVNFGVLCNSSYDSAVAHVYKNGVAIPGATVSSGEYHVTKVGSIATDVSPGDIIEIYRSTTGNGTGAITTFEIRAIITPNLDVVPTW